MRAKRAVLGRIEKNFAPQLEPLVPLLFTLFGVMVFNNKSILVSSRIVGIGIGFYISIIFIGSIGIYAPLGPHGPTASN